MTTTGNWLVEGNPQVVLFDIGSASHLLNSWKQELYESTFIGKILQYAFVCLLTAKEPYSGACSEIREERESIFFNPLRNLENEPHFLSQFLLLFFVRKYL